MPTKKSFVWLNSPEFLAFALLAVFATVLAFFGTFDQARWDAWAEFMKWIGSAFLVGKGIAKIGSTES